MKILFLKFMFKRLQIVNRMEGLKKCVRLLP